MLQKVESHSLILKLLQKYEGFNYTFMTLQVYKYMHVYIHTYMQFPFTWAGAFQLSSVGSDITNKGKSIPSLGKESRNFLWDKHDMLPPILNI